MAQQRKLAAEGKQRSYLAERPIASDAHAS
jgi:hypothetical protein